VVVASPSPDPSLPRRSPHGVSAQVRPEVIHLRPREYALLALLASHPGRAYSRRELLDRAWGRNHPGGEGTVDVHVRWLRSKIEPKPDQPVHLVTVRGTGYRLDSVHR
jgi:DNA-binding response OmpR family regulator